MKSFKEHNENVAECIPVAVNESSLSRVWKQAKDHDTGTISAYRDARNCNTGEPYTKKDKEKRSAILRAKLIKLGYGVTTVKGTYIENFKTKNAIKVKEKAFLVVDIKSSGNLWRDLTKLGLEFEQDSVTFSKPSGEYVIIGTNKCPEAYPGWKKVEKLGKSMFGKKGEFFSRVNGRPFVFESIENRLTELKGHGISQIRSIVHLSECTIDNGEIIKP